jgi:hypothetical protein
MLFLPRRPSRGEDVKVEKFFQLRPVMPLVHQPALHGGGSVSLHGLLEEKGMKEGRKG